MGLLDSWDDIFEDYDEKLTEFSDVVGFNELADILRNLRYDHKVLIDLSVICAVDTKEGAYNVDIGDDNMSFILNAKDAFGSPPFMHFPPFTKLLSIHSFKNLYGLVEEVYVLNSGHRLTDTEYASIYLSDIGEQLSFNVENFDKNLPISVVDEISFFKKLKNISFRDKRAKKVAKLIYSYFCVVDGEDDIGISRDFSRLVYFVSSYLSGCSALRNRRDNISCEDVVTGYLTVFKLINCDVRSLIPLMDDWKK
ncbi:hypothetical protein [Methanobrevibacter filiformis]|uniref:Uncharacterized protein n=1 Tax=Methanobrevibacter filiformis TaxID=55758 RepID=A0A165YYG3_9EURY|nr:hypothetical protein [Methanobrevibacter filiformis]KZX10029.1 hypothetical protein MBFIL_19240 [Methanobrevibacter filiformis]